MKNHSIPLWEKAAHSLTRQSAIVLHMMVPPEYTITLEVTKDQRPIQRYETFGHSWTRNAYNQLCRLAGVDANGGSVNNFGGGFISCKDTGGTIRFNELTRTAYAQVITAGGAAGNALLAAAADATFGIQVGSNVAGESFEDFVLATLITNGTGGGQLSYIASEVTTMAYDAPSKTMTLTLIRFMNNNSGGNVSVNEVALTNCSPSNSCKVVYSRDHLGATVVIPDKGQLKVTYTIQIVFPA